MPFCIISEKEYRNIYKLVVKDIQDNPELLKDPAKYISDFNSMLIKEFEQSSERAASLIKVIPEFITKYRASDSEVLNTLNKAEVNPIGYIKLETEFEDYEGVINYLGTPTEISREIPLSTIEKGKWYSVIDSLFGKYIAEKGFSFHYLNSGNKNEVDKVKNEIYGMVIKDLKNYLSSIESSLLQSNNYGEILNIKELFKTANKITNPVFSGRIFGDHYGSLFNRISSDIIDFEEQLNEGNEDSNEEIQKGDSESKEETEDIQNTTDNQIHDQVLGEQSVIKSGSPEVKMFIKTLSKVKVHTYETLNQYRLDESYLGLPILNTKGEPELETDENGLPIPIDFSKIYMKTLDLVSGSYNDEEMLHKMDLPENRRVLPELALMSYRINKIKENNKSDYSTLTRFPNSLYNTFGSWYFMPVYTLKQYDSKFFITEEIRKNNEKISKKWSDTFFRTNANSELVKKGIISIDKDNRPFISPNSKIKDFNIDNKSGKIEYLSALGINFSWQTQLSPEFREFIESNAVYYLKVRIDSSLLTGEDIYDPINTVKRPLNIQKGEGTISANGQGDSIKKMLKMEGKYTPDLASLSFRNADGNQQYGMIPRNIITDIHYLFKSITNKSQLALRKESKHLSEDHNPNIIGSIFISSMFQKTSGNFRTSVINGRDTRQPNLLQIGMYNGLNYFEGSKEVNKTTHNLNSREKLIMDLHSLLGSGMIDIMRTSSSKSYILTKIPTYFINYKTGYTSENLPISLNEFKKDNASDIDVVNTVLRGYLVGEIATIINAYNSDINYKDFSKWGIFNDNNLIPLEVKHKLEEEAKELKAKYNVEDIKERRKLIKDIEALVEKYKNKYTFDKYFKIEAETFINYALQNGINITDMGIEGTENMSSLQIANAFYINNFILNAEFIKVFAGPTSQFKEYNKRAKGYITPGDSPNISESNLNRIKSTWDKTMYSMFGRKAPESIEDLKTYKSKVFKDDERPSRHTSTMIENLRKFNFPFFKMTDKLEKLISKSYNKMTIADGQGHITLDFYRIYRMMVNSWTDNDEKGYFKEMLIYKKDKQGLSEEEQKELDGYENIKVTFPPMKLSYKGPLSKDGVHASIYDKFSLVPLIPSVIKGRELEAINEELVKQGIGYTKFKSGTKDFSENIIDFYRDGNLNIELGTEEEAQELFTKYLRQTIKTSSSTKKEVRWGTQMRKLFIANLTNIGVPLDQFKELLDKYNDNMKKISEYNKQKLYDDLGFEERDDKYFVEDWDKLQKMLVDQAKQRGLNSNVINSIKYDPITKNLKFPLETTTNKNSILDLINGIIDKGLRQLFVNGDALIQVASTGFSKPTSKQIDQYGNYDLKFYELQIVDGKPVRTSKMQVKVSLQGDFKKLLNRTDVKELAEEKGIEPRLALNILIKDKRWMERNSRLVSMVGYRIPTQGINSMESMEVAEFLPEEAGNIIIPPPEIVAKSGSDYDIDKLTIIRPYISNSGYLINDKSIELLQKKVNDKGNRLVDNMFGISDEERQADLEDNVDDLNNKKLINEIITIYDSILTSPEAYPQLIIPNNADSIKESAERMAKKYRMQGFDYEGKALDYKNTGILSYVNNAFKNVQNGSGKLFISIFSSTSVFSQLLQQSGVKLPKKGSKVIFSEIVKNKRQNITINYTNHLLTEDEADKVSMSSVLDSEGDVKQQFLSELMTSTVDIEKDPYFMALGINKKNVGVFTFLLLSGVPFNRAVSFLNQPVLKELYRRDQVKPFMEFESGDSSGLSDDMKELLNVKTTTSKVTFPAFTVHMKEMLKELGLISKNDKLNVINAVNESDNNIGITFTDEILNSYIDDFYETNTTVQGYYNKVKSEEVEKRNNQLDVLTHFYKLTKFANLTLQLRGTTVFDTRKVGSVFSSVEWKQQIENVKASGLFNEEALNNIWNNSLVSNFNNVDEIQDILSSIMPVGMDTNIATRALNIIKERPNSKVLYDKNLRLKFERVIFNDWMEYIIKSFGEVQGVSFNTYIKSLTKGSNTLSDRLLKLVADFPSLEENPLISRLFTNTSKKEIGLKNIELYLGLDNTVATQEQLLYEFNKFYNFNEVRIDKTEVSEDQVMEIRNLFKDLMYLSFAQSGFNKGVLYFLDIVPLEIQNMFKNANQYYKDNIKGTKDNQFKQQFFTQFETEKGRIFGLDNHNTVRDTWRGAMYEYKPNLKSTDLIDQTTKENEALKAVKEEVKPETDTGVQETFDDSYSSDNFDEFISEPVSETKSLLNPEDLINNQVFMNKEVELVNEIPSDKDVVVGAQQKNGKIFISLKALQDKFNNKAWTNSTIQGDSTKSTPLPDNQFGTFEEFLTFVLLHERSHMDNPRQKGESIGQYEDRINKLALGQLQEYIKPKIDNITPEEGTTYKCKK